MQMWSRRWQLLDISHKNSCGGNSKSVFATHLHKYMTRLSKTGLRTGLSALCTCHSLLNVFRIQLPALNRRREERQVKIVWLLYKLRPVGVATSLFSEFERIYWMVFLCRLFSILYPANMFLITENQVVRYVVPESHRGDVVRIDGWCWVSGV